MPPTSVASPLPETTTHYRRIATGLVIPAAEGQRTFVSQRKMFPGWFDSDWEAYKTDRKSKPQPETPADVYEQTKNGTLMELLTSFHTDPTTLVWTQDQALTFIEKHPDWFKNDDPAVLFPLEGSFVARVYRCYVSLRAYVPHFDYGLVWYAGFRCRLVLPQRVL